jgi:hypothetical protein
MGIRLLRKLSTLGRMVPPGSTIDSIRDAIFRRPTLAEAYKVATSDGLNKL